MNRTASRRLQRGYLYETPVLLTVFIVSLIVVLPHLRRTHQQILLGVAAVPILICLYRLIVTPGWSPTSAGRAGASWRLKIFIACAAVLVAGVGVFILR